MIDWVIFGVVVVFVVILAWPGVSSTLTKLKAIEEKEKSNDVVKIRTQEIIDSVELEVDPLMCLTSLEDLDYTQRLQCYKALRNHIAKTMGPEAAKKLDTDVLPIVIDDKI